MAIVELETLERVDGRSRREGEEMNQDPLSGEFPAVYQYKQPHCNS
jgi:hypothetical protein